MLSAASFLTTLPPASLAAADFPRFISRTLNRHAADELPQLLAVLEAQSLSGYPITVAPVLRLIVQTVREQNLDPAEMDPKAVSRLMSRREWIEAADDAVGLERTPLRPGEPFGGDGAAGRLNSDRVRLLAGGGEQHYLVTAAQVLRIQGLGWSHIEGLVVARPMATEEAEALRETWAIIEETFGIGEDARGMPWQAELTRIASRQNLRSERCREVLQALSTDARRRLWRVLLEYLRDGELDDAHRPSLRSLGERLRAADLSLLGARLDHVLALAQSAYGSCRIDPAVIEGLCPCHGGDLALYGQWIEVPEASRERLLEMTPQLVEFELRRLAEIENHGADLPMSETRRRDLRGLRDTCLRRRYALDLSGLAGVDPLLLAEERLREGHDAGAILRDLSELRRRVRGAAQAMHVAQSSQVSSVNLGPTSVGIPATAHKIQGAPVDETTGTHQTSAASPSTKRTPSTPAGASPKAGLQARQFVAPKGTTSPEPAEAPVLREGRRSTSRMNAAGKTLAPQSAPNQASETSVIPSPAASELTAFPQDAATQRAMQLPKESPEPAPSLAPPAPSIPRPARPRPTSDMVLPPMPKPPPWSRTVTRPNIVASDLPPMPTAPRRRIPTAEETPGAKPDVALNKAPRPRRVRPTTTRIITPAQTEEFYEQAFRELEVLERDLLERGPWAQARERLLHLRAEAKELSEAAGPAARSGDKEFAAAVQRIKLVQAYLERVEPLLERKPTPVQEAPEPTKAKRRWFFNKD